MIKAIREFFANLWDWFLSYAPQKIELSMGMDFTNGEPVDQCPAIVAPAERYHFRKHDDLEMAFRIASKWLDSPMGLHTDQLILARAFLYVTLIPQEGRPQ